MAEKRLIDSDEARRRIIAFANGLHSEVLPVDTVVMLLIQMPPVDAVEVVRCKDCKNNGQCSIQDAMNWGKTTVNGENFCSHGERKDDGSDG